MIFLKIASLLCSASISAAVSTFEESISAQGLLGSHFGIPGRPAIYDFVVIGGGTAGLTIARRLVQNSSTSVAVIEAGDFYEFSNGNLSEIPAYASFFTGNDPEQKNPSLDWYQYTEPQPVSWPESVLAVVFPLPCLIDPLAIEQSQIPLRLWQTNRWHECSKFPLADAVCVGLTRPPTPSKHCSLSNVLISPEEAGVPLPNGQIRLEMTAISSTVSYHSSGEAPTSTLRTILSGQAMPQLSTILLTGVRLGVRCRSAILRG